MEAWDRSLPRMLPMVPTSDGINFIATHGSPISQIWSWTSNSMENVELRRRVFRPSNNLDNNDAVDNHTVFTRNKNHRNNEKKTIKPAIERGGFGIRVDLDAL
mmetsp:Transcript_3067/g.7239  ORF Transcript_3067/g.7239 Transcript_3067/m.7239 type:complete len:103 (+) Transcript_3067:686-994(+)